MRQLLSWCVLVGVSLHGSAAAGGNGDRVLSIQLKRPNVVIRGSNLSKVEIWALPTGTGLGDQHLVFGSAVRTGRAGAAEKWVFRLPPCDSANLTLASAIVAVGFDRTGTEVGSKQLPNTSAMQLYDTLCVK
jgi:hypothetical protein